MQTGPLFEKLQTCTKKIVVLQGGTSSGKTVTALQHLGVQGVKQKGQVISIIGQDIPNLKKGALRDFQHHVYNDPKMNQYFTDYNKSDRLFTGFNKSIWEFYSVADEQDARSGKRDYLFVNEANGIPYMNFWQLQRRTRKQVIIDYNPSTSFWCHEVLLNPNNKEFAGKVQLFITDHRHNPFLTDEEHESIENISDPELWRVYARGLTGKVSGLIFGHFQKADAAPQEYDRVIWGIDYGYTNDPTALVKIYCVGRKRYWKECSYYPGISADRILEIMIDNGYKEGESIYSEADPNMINQLRALRLSVMPAIKGPGSVQAGISKVREHECYWIDGSYNLRFELDNYKFVKASDIVTGKEVLTNLPVDGHDHLCDAGRYAIYTDSFRYRK